MTQVKIMFRDLGMATFVIDKKKETIQYEMRCAIDHKTSFIIIDRSEHQEYIINPANIIYFIVTDDGESKDITN
jgi:hypothetical protein